MEEKKMKKLKIKSLSNDTIFLMQLLFAGLILDCLIFLLTTILLLLPFTTVEYNSALKILACVKKERFIKWFVSLSTCLLLVRIIFKKIYEIFPITAIQLLYSSLSRLKFQDILLLLTLLTCLCSLTIDEFFLVGSVLSFSQILLINNTFSNNFSKRK